MDVALSAISGIPKRIAIPAAVATASYLDAKYGFRNDAKMLSVLIGYAIHCGRMEKADNFNTFYLLEKWAIDKKTANRPMLEVPKDPERPTQQTSWTFAQGYELILKHAAWLKQTHLVQKGEIVAMDFSNRPGFIWMWFAIWSLGAIPAFINSNLRENAFVHCVKISGSRLLFVDPEIAEVLTNETSQALLNPDEKGRAIEAIILDTEIQRDILNTAPYRAPNSDRGGIKRSDTAMLIYTSGTTGLPKAANVNWGKPVAGYYVFSRYLNLKPHDKYFSAMPLYHSSASLLGFCPVLANGSTFILAPKFSPRNFSRQLTETGATALQYIGEICRYLVNTPPSPYDRAHKVTRAVGNGMRPDVWQRFKDRFNIGEIIEFYGATESPGVTLIASRNDFLRGSIGRDGLIFRTFINANILAKFDVDKDELDRDPKTGFCIKCKADEVGELLHALDAKDVEARYFGYHGNEKASKSKIMFDVFKKGDAYYRTGDLQRRDADGRLWFMDRIGDTFRWKSENVSTAEVSEALGRHPALQEANVYGVQLPNHDGRAGCVALTLTNGANLDDNTLRGLAAHARKNLPKYAVPLFLRLVKEVEVTGTMKHQKVALRNQGVDPEKTEDDEIFWLQPGADAYAKFGQEEWKQIQAGQAKL